MSVQQLPFLNPLIDMIQDKVEIRLNKAQHICERNSELKTSTSSIPLPKSHVQRTESELQFCNDQIAAEYRDSIMFQRLVRGIEESHDRGYCPCYVLTQNEKAIENIISTRSSNSKDQNDDDFVPSGFLSTIYQDEKTVARPVSPMRGDCHDDGWFIDDIQDDICASSPSIILDIDFSRPPSSIESIVSDDSVFSDDDDDIFDLEL